MPLFSHVFFDCDSTLIKIEGIDALAELAGVGPEVAELTRRAMEGSVSLQEVWDRRLNMIKPTDEHIQEVAKRCVREIPPGAHEVIARLREAGKEVHIISGGLWPIVRAVATALGIPEDRTHAEVLDKVAFVKSLLPAGSRSAFIGDGSTDLATKDVVDLFIAYNGVVSRPQVCQDANVCITTPDLTALLPHLL